MVAIPESLGEWVADVYEQAQKRDADPDDLGLVFQSDFNEVQGLRSELGDSAGVPPEEVEKLSLGTLWSLASDDGGDDGDGTTPDPKSMSPEGNEPESAEISRLKDYREKLEEKDSRLAEQMIDDVDKQIAELQGQ